MFVDRNSLIRIFFIFSAAFILLTAISACAGLEETPEPLDIQALPQLKNRPEGFEELKWGDPSSKMNAEDISMHEGDSVSETFVLSGDGISWDDFAINDVNFLFTKDQLVMVRISFLESVDEGKLKKHLLKKFEKPSVTKEANGGTVTLWEDEEIGVVLQLYSGKLSMLVLMNHKLANSLR